MSIILDGTSGITTPGETNTGNNTVSGNETITGTLTASNFNAASTFGFKNRIINGAMVIDQRNAGAAVTIDQTGGTYTLDRWYGRDDSPGAYSIQQVSDAPTGFKNSLKITITTTGTPGAAQYGFVGTWIEGYNTADLSFGTASASTITLSFWVKSSVTGQFGGSITNSAQDRTYPFSFTIISASTWEQKTVTLVGDTTGTWLTTNGAGIGVNFAVGIGSNFLGTANTWTGSFKMSATGQTNLYATSAATLQFTGVQLEIGSTATTFERRLYNQELANCQRYYAKSYAQGTIPGTSTSVGISGQSSGGGGTYTDLLTVTLPVIMRTTATVSFWDTVGNSSKITRIIANSTTTNSAGSSAFESDRSFCLYGTSGIASANGLYAHWVASAEL